MERLTKSGNNGLDAVPVDLNGWKISDAANKSVRRMVNQLAEYEETGLMPAEIKAGQKLPEKVMDYICDELCRHPRTITDQEELDEICAACPLN